MDTVSWDFTVNQNIEFCFVKGSYLKITGWHKILLMPMDISICSFVVGQHKTIHTQNDPHVSGKILHIRMLWFQGKLPACTRDNTSDNSGICTKMWKLYNWMFPSSQLHLWKVIDWQLFSSLMASLTSTCFCFHAFFKTHSYTLMQIIIVCFPQIGAQHLGWCGKSLTFFKSN